jgi:hypothetical protein
MPFKQTFFPKQNPLVGICKIQYVGSQDFATPPIPKTEYFLIGQGLHIKASSNWDKSTFGTGLRTHLNVQPGLKAQASIASSCRPTMRITSPFSSLTT